MQTELRVFFVDDDLYFHRFFASFTQRINSEFKSSYLSVEFFENPLEAKSALIQSNLDVLVTDFQMLPINGLLLARFAEEVIPELKIIVCSSLDRKSIETQTKLNPSWAFVEKSSLYSSLTELFC